MNRDLPRNLKLITGLPGGLRCGLRHGAIEQRAAAPA
jgi:hypothetical protein